MRTFLTIIIAAGLGSIPALVLGQRTLELERRAAKLEGAVSQIGQFDQRIRRIEEQALHLPQQLETRLEPARRDINELRRELQGVTRLLRLLSSEEVSGLSSESQGAGIGSSIQQTLVGTHADDDAGEEKAAVDQGWRVVIFERPVYAQQRGRARVSTTLTVLKDGFELPGVGRWEFWKVTKFGLTVAGPERGLEVMLHPWRSSAPPVLISPFEQTIESQNELYTHFADIYRDWVQAGSRRGNWR